MYSTKRISIPRPIMGKMIRLISHPRLKCHGAGELTVGEGVYDVGTAIVRECGKSVISVGTGTAVSSLKSLRSIGWE